LRGHCDEWEIETLRANGTRQFRPGRVRQPHVEHREIIGLALQPGERLGAIFCEAQDRAGAFERCGHHLAIRRHVFDIEHSAASELRNDLVLAVGDRSARGWRKGQRDDKARSLSRSARDFQRATLQFDKRAGDAQAETRTISLPRVEASGLHERLENAVDIFGRDADAGVLDNELDAASVERCGCQANAPVVSKLQGITEQIVQDLSQPHGIAVHHRRQIR
jgi:hypothetical protein